jgi:hypothetical protein
MTPRGPESPGDTFVNMLRDAARESGESREIPVAKDHGGPDPAGLPVRKPGTALKSGAEEFVSTENQRARENARDADVLEAKGLLSGLMDRLKDATRDKLAKVHDLEGILCLYRG